MDQRGLQSDPRSTPDCQSACVVCYHWPLFGLIVVVCVQRLNNCLQCLACISDAFLTLHHGTGTVRCAVLFVMLIIVNRTVDRVDITAAIVDF